MTKILGLSAVAAAGLFGAAGIYFTNQIMHIKKKTDQMILEKEKNAFPFFNQQVFETLNKEVFHVNSRHGYVIQGFYIPADPPNTEKYMIFCHGVTVNRYTSIKYAKLFLNRGFNVILYDARRHGQSGGKTTSYGYYEKDDLASVVDWVRTRFPGNILLGIHGESMGAATMLQYAGLVADGADFYIADCPFSDFSKQLCYLLKRDYHLPRWSVLPATRLFLRLRDGYQLKYVSPILGMRNVHHPVLFIHSKDDRYIPASMSKELYAAKPDNKALFIAENGGHACSYSENPEAYEKALDQFLESSVFNGKGCMNGQS